ncbi:MAG TPA: tetratricopeptide repeat protein [Bryobacteraceae bacterium]|nr:tetratricopeptide repeat protein [Bryobacteraceae bacterium]
MHLSGRTSQALLWAAAILAQSLNGQRGARTLSAAITVDYPAENSVFPPDFAPPTFLWRDGSQAANWVVWVEFGSGAEAMRIRATGELLRVGEIDPRAVAATNQPPKLTPEQSADHTWQPDAARWEDLKKRAAGGLAAVTITGYAGGSPASTAKVHIRISRDPVGAPIFYRDVPLMPSETEKGVIKPLSPKAVPLIAWRLRNVAETRSRVLMTGIHSCANCHSFSLDAATMGLDVDGPQNDKGLYAILPVQRRMAIQKENVVAWSTFRGKLGGKLRVGFMSQVSPHGDYVVTTINDPGEGQTDYARRKRPEDLVQNYYVANFKDYRFLQVFYPTRGILAWYSRQTGRLQLLPGADDPRYVHVNAVWSPDGKYLVFARARARDAYTPGVNLAERANDPNETQIQYDLYRIPFNQGRGGTPAAIAGASQNGMSNSFPKVSPDGRWIVFVQARNGELMRPDGRLYIVPSAGGAARRMNCNTPLMNSWHSFSPNGRWLVFSSKSRSPYTQLFLTHIDEDGNDTPAILIENSTSANRAANIPEFVNVAPGGIEKIDAPVTEYYRIIDEVAELMEKRDYAAALPKLREAEALNPDEASVHNNLGIALAETGQPSESLAEYEKAIALSPDFAEAYNNLGNALARLGKMAEAVARYQQALDLDPQYSKARSNFGVALARMGRPAEAIPHLEKALDAQPDDAEVHTNLGLSLAMVGRIDEGIPHLEKALAMHPDFESEFNLARVLAAQGRFPQAIPHFEQASKLAHGRDVPTLDLLGGAYAEVGRLTEALETAQRALAIAETQQDAALIQTLRTRITYYQSRLAQQK